MNQEPRPNTLSMTASAVLPANWVRNPLSSTDIAEHLARVLKEKHDLESRFTEVLLQRDKLQQRLLQATGELESQKIRLNEEIADLQKQLTNSAQPAIVGKGRQSAEFAARERLNRDAIQREIQTLQIELKQERHRSAQQIERLKRDLSGCICRSSAR